MRNTITKLINWTHKNLGWFALAFFVFGVTAKEIIGTGLTLSGKRVTTITDVATDEPDQLTALVTEYRLTQALAGIELSGGNAMEVKNIRDYGAVANVSVPGSGATVTGTNNLTAFQNAYNATPRGGIMFIPAGNWLVQGGLTFTTKDVVIIQLGNVYTNGTNYITLGAPGGADRVWSLIILGKIIGRVNIPTNSTTTRGAGTSPVWSSFTGTAITLNANVNNSHVKVKWIEGFAKAVEIQGGGGGGSQENTIAFERMWYNAIGISLKNTDGLGWVDKNHFTGWDYGCARITGGLCVKIDGYSGAASTNGEAYNGAFRSNVFHFLAERVDSLIEAKGDVTYNKFDITIEGGTSTGVFAQTNVINCRTTSPNPVRNTEWTGQGILGDRYIKSTGGNSLGLDARINQDFYLNSSVFIGNRGRTDGTGVVYFETKASLSKTNRDALSAMGIKCYNEQTVPTVRSITIATGQNTASDAGGIILYDHSAGSFSCVNASTNVGVSFTVKNINGSNNLTLFNVNGKATLGPGESVDIFCNGSTYYAKTTGTSYTP